MFDAYLQHHESRIDRLQVAALCGLMVLGALFVYSATMVSGSASLAACGAGPATLGPVSQGPAATAADGRIGRFRRRRCAAWIITPSRAGR